MFPRFVYFSSLRLSQVGGRGFLALLGWRIGLPVRFSEDVLFRVILTSLLRVSARSIAFVFLQGLYACAFCLAFSSPDSLYLVAWTGITSLRASTVRYAERILLYKRLLGTRPGILEEVKLGPSLLKRKKDLFLIIIIIFFVTFGSLLKLCTSTGFLVSWLVCFSVSSPS